MRAGKTPMRRSKEAGIVLYLVAASMVLLIGVLGLAVDLVSYYTVRSEAQRAADAAALAGASVFVASGCTGGVSGAACTSGCGAHSRRQPGGRSGEREQSRRPESWNRSRHRRDV